MSARARGVAASALALATLGVGCGTTGSSAVKNPLAWIGTPQVFAPRDLPRDRIVVGRVRNASKISLRLAATAIRVLDANGHPLKGSGGFTTSYAHGLFGAFQQPSVLPIRELVRLGRIAILEPGATSPLFAAWRLASDAREPVAIDYGRGVLTVPSAFRLAAP